MKENSFGAFLIFCLMLTSSLEARAGGCGHDQSNFKCVEFIDNYDGDTATFYIDGVHPLLGDHIAVRVRGIDTPEINTNDSCEYEKAKKARALLHSLLLKANRIDLEHIGRGKYFRIVADILADGRSVAKPLLKAGLAVRYEGGTKADVDWCN